MSDRTTFQEDMPLPAPCAKLRIPGGEASARKRFEKLLKFPRPPIPPGSNPSYFRPDIFKTAARRFPVLFPKLAQTMFSSQISKLFVEFASLVALSSIEVSDDYFCWLSNWEQESMIGLTRSLEY